MSAELCIADFIDATVECCLPAGHDGDHEGTITWPQSPVPPPFDAEANPGYAAFLRSKYSAAGGG